MVKQFTDWAAERGWNIKKRDGDMALPEEIAKRYDLPTARMPSGGRPSVQHGCCANRENALESWLEFIRQFSLCANKEFTKWFITFEDFGEEGFRWNEFEQISLEAADDDTEWRKQVTDFWDKHLPVFMSVEGEYEYYAVNVESGQVVFGFEPEFEEPETAADSFEDFIGKIVTGEIIL